MSKRGQRLHSTPPCVSHSSKQNHRNAEHLPEPNRASTDGHQHRQHLPPTYPLSAGAKPGLSWQRLHEARCASGCWLHPRCCHHCCCGCGRLGVPAARVPSAHGLCHLKGLRCHQPSLTGEQTAGQGHCPCAGGCCCCRAQACCCQPGH
jgi:hypothetical protein